MKSPNWERENPPSKAALEAVSAGLGLDGLLSQFSRFLMKKGESLAGAHVSWAVSGIAAAVSAEEHGNSSKRRKKPRPTYRLAKSWL